MRLFIAEKPSVARVIAAELGPVVKQEGHLRVGKDIITWCFGHMLEQAEPDHYTSDQIPRTKSGKKRWRLQDLPIIPQQWVLLPKKESKKQLSVIGKLLKGAQVIVNAGDPDREGQLLVDEVLNHFKNRKPVQRFWVSAQDAVSIQRGLQRLRQNSDYLGWADAARARQRADWLIGMNLSRAYTLQAQKNAGGRALVTVGRVQTPTLALVVARDREIEAFKPVPYFTLEATLQHNNGAFQAKWQPKETQAGLDSEGRLIDAAIADQIKQRVEHQSGAIVSYQQQLKKAPHPTAFALSDITVLASSKYGLSADEVLKGCQALYETHKLTSYPRTDCGHLPESQHADAPAVLSALKKVNPELSDLIDSCDTRFKSHTWNDKKITAHHGIIPTMHVGNKHRLSANEKKLYELIVRAYIAQFYPYHEYLSTTVKSVVADEVFMARGRVTKVVGWKAVYQEGAVGQDQPKAAQQRIPVMAKGDKVDCTVLKRHDLMTKPPYHFTDGSLIRAMETIHRFVSNPEHKKLLREGDGIGTSATRASIITELKRRGFLVMQGKKVLSSPLGRSVVDSLPAAVTSPVLTALYERMLKGIEQGEAEIAQFMAKQEAFIQKQVIKAMQSSSQVVAPTTQGRWAKA